MPKSVSNLHSRKRIRRNFGKLNEIAKMPNLIEVQRSSYDQFLQADTPSKDRERIGLHEAFASVFPIEDASGRAKLQFVSYDLESPKYDVEECQQRGLTFASALKVTLRLEVFEINEDTGNKDLTNIKEQDVYMGDMPLMTNNGTFVVNGVERVIVSQMHRSPGVFFDHDKGKSHASGKLLFAARIIPYRGSWLDFEYDAKDILNVRIDRKRKLPASTFLMCLPNEKSLRYIESINEKIKENGQENAEQIDPYKINGMDRQEILSIFYKNYNYYYDDGNWKCDFLPELFKGLKLISDIIDAETGKVVAKSGIKLHNKSIKKLLDEGLKFIKVSHDDLLEKFIAEDIVDMKTGIVIAEAGDELNEELIQSILNIDRKTFKVLAIDNVNFGPHLRNTLSVDKNNSRAEALADIYRVMRPGEPPTLEGANELFMNLFFESEKYDLSSVGRVKMNARLDLNTDDDFRILNKDDVLSVLKVLVDLKDGRGEVDDIDHLGNRRVRSVGELMENQYRVGLLRMQRAIKERMGSVEIDTVMPADLINAKPAAAAVREFFGSSQLSQFMDQTNPLSEITHKRRVSALGPGGLTRERAGFEVRDVHPTHYGRICPIETPEGPNIGLINSLATFAQINRYGFIETPYRKVVEGKVTDDFTYVSAMQEGKYTIAQANAQLDSKGNFVGELIPVRKSGEIGLARPTDIDFIDVSPKQLVSVAAALIPFLENDDANRALMGSICKDRLYLC